MAIPLPIIPGVSRVSLNWHHNTGQTAANVIHIHDNAGGHTPGDLFEALQDAMTATMWDSTSSDANIQTVGITPLDGVSATTTFVTGGPANMSGAVGGDFSPASAVVIKMGTGLRGRDHRGRVFLPMIGEGAISDGFISDAEVLILTNAWVTFQNSLLADAGGPWELVVASYDRRHAGIGAHGTLVTSLTAEKALGTQRRRQGRLR